MAQKIYEDRRTDLGRRITEAMRNAGIATITDLSEKVHVSKQGLSRIVQGKVADPASSIIADICRVTGCSADWLLLGRVPETEELGQRVEIVVRSLTPNVRIITQDTED